MNLAIDFGNTRAKAALFDQNELREIFNDFKIGSLSGLVQEKKLVNTIVSTVNGNDQEIEGIEAGNVIRLTHSTPLPFQIAYKTPETLGIDRIAAVAGAQFMFPNQNCLVIDIGTCITFDLLDASGTYQGGAISPGVGIRFKALNTFTANLPLVEAEETVPLIGQTTESCMQSGVINGVNAEINEIIRMYRSKYTNLQIILCGGGANYFENRLKGHIFAAPELVLRGLNRILLYNV